MPDLEYLRQKAAIQTAFESLNNEKPEREEYLARFFDRFFPFCMDSLHASIAPLKRSGTLPVYSDFILTLPLYAEPPALLINALPPSDTIHLLTTTRSENDVLPWLERHWPQGVRKRTHSIEDLDTIGIRDLLHRIHAGAKGRVLVDMTGGKKSTTVNMVLGVRDLERVDYCYLDGQVQRGSLISNRPLPGTQQLVLWREDHLRTIRETVISLEGREQLTVSGAPDRGLVYGLRSGGSWAEESAAALPDALLKELRRVFDTPDRPSAEALLAAGSVFFDQALPAPVKRRLSRLPAGAVLEILADSGAEHLPWEAVRLDGSALQERFLLTRIIPSPATGRADHSPSALVVSNPTEDKLLTTAETEGRAVAGILSDKFGKENVTFLHGSEATVFRVLDELSRHGIFHFSGHSTPEGLRMADGVLTSGQIASASSLPAFCRANSCRSASPGIGSAFLTGGCRTYIGARWLLDDVEAAATAVSMYSDLFAGMAAGEAVLRTGLPPATLVVYGEQYPGFA